MMSSAPIVLAGSVAAQEIPAPSPPQEHRDQSVRSEPNEQDGPAYTISALDLAYLREHHEQPPLDAIADVEVTLGRTAPGLVSPREGVELEAQRVGDFGRNGPEVIYASALQRILEAIRDEFTSRGLIGVYVAPDRRQISEEGEDIRRPGETRLTILITTGIVTELRTLASGNRVTALEHRRTIYDDLARTIAAEQRINHAAHARIRRNSPIQPQTPDEPEAPSLLRRDVLDRYAYFLSRHPGRQVDISLGPATEPGGVALDYDITENRPLTIYGQVSNTGTKQTDYWRERIGFFHTQLTNNDDILSFDYTTNLDDVHALYGSYEAPFQNDRWRYRAFGGWNEFTADQVGFFGDTFTGESWSAGGQVIWNFYQHRELFLDAFIGARFLDVEVDNQAILVSGEQDFFIPQIGVRLERTTARYDTQALVALEFQVGDVTNVDRDDLNALGRTDPDEDWVVLQWAAEHSFFLEPVIDPEGWRDPSTPHDSTLAHELSLSFRGQYAFDYRLIPQVEQVAGGLYSVRGYPESVVAGDTVVIGSAEYRFHVPRAFRIEPEPRRIFGQPFRVAPQYVYGAPDWDLVLKGFLDAARTINSDRLSFEEDQTLVGTGLGLELLIKRNVNIRLDWGFALEPVDVAQVHSGSNRLHFAATILF